MSKQQIEERVRAVPFWFHSIDVGQGIVTPGFKTSAVLSRELDLMRLPEMRGKTVLDINAWDGFYAFKAEERGASSVTALDYYMWAMDLGEHVKYIKECREKGVYPERYETRPYYKPNELPGKRGFDLAHELLGSKVNKVVGDFMAMDLDNLGQFDVVFFLGSLYHMENAFESLKRLARVTREVAVIETQAAEFPGFGSQSLVQFFESGELAGDSSNWWAPNMTALAAMCRAAGFKRVELVREPPVWSRSSLLSILRNLIESRTFSRVWSYRAIVHAWK
ncbi:MAG: class I SAM-dependent methyltransferase [Limisphaerales bacterium]